MLFGCDRCRFGCHDADVLKLRPPCVFVLTALLPVTSCTTQPTPAPAGAAPRVLKRTLQTALVWTLYEELLPRLSAVYHLAVAQQAADQEQEQQQGGSSSSRGAGGRPKSS